jgi:hypothetical protein
MTFREWLLEEFNVDIDLLLDDERATYYERYCKAGYGLDI